MGRPSDALCAQCKRLSPYYAEKKSRRITIPYNRSDQYPGFPMLEAQARKGCTFCGLLRHTLQAKYSDEKIAEAESDFHPTIRSEWHTGWDGHVTVDGAVFKTEEDWAERDVSLTSDLSLGGIRSIFFNVWPYPPRRSQIEHGFNGQWVFFAVYNDNGNW